MKKIDSCDNPFSGRFILGVFLSEWYVWSVFSVITFFVASVLMSGWPAGLIPDIRYPYVYGGDGMFNLEMIKKVMEGFWVYVNNRAGFPFGGNSFDYTIPDTGSLLALKALGSVFGTPQAAFNLYFLIGFPLAFLFSYLFFRVIGISRAFSVAAGLLFVFLPFHQQRVGHLFYTWYFVVPIFFFFAFYLFKSAPEILQTPVEPYNIRISALVLFGLAFFGVYYAFFGCILFFVSTVAGMIRHKSYKSFRIGLFSILLILLGVFANMAPSIIYKLESNTKNNVMKRSPGASEVYGLKLIQMLLPRQGHRVWFLDKAAAHYQDKSPLVNENAWSALGVVGAAGLLSLFCMAFLLMSGQQLDTRLAFFSIVTVFLFCFATIGGFSSLFAWVISSKMRAWNRISVFIGFAAISASFLILQISLKRFSCVKEGKLTLCLAVLLGLMGFLDQTNQISAADRNAISKEFESDREFVKEIEANLPVNSAIYQLPYMAFPEEPPLYNLADASLWAGFFHSNSLRWSFGGMKHREGDLFFKALAAQPLKRQVEVISRLGFAGIYIDRRGLKDSGQELEAQLRQILGSGPQLQSANHSLVFFKIPHPETFSSEGLNVYEIIKRSGFTADYHSTNNPGIIL